MIRPHECCCLEVPDEPCYPTRCYPPGRRSLTCGTIRSAAAGCSIGSDNGLRYDQSDRTSGHATVPAQGNQVGVCEDWPATTTLQQVLEHLEAALSIIPGDDWILGHVVGMHLNSDNPDRAWQVAAECSGTPWWCLELQGLVLHETGRHAEAEAAFLRSLAGMPAVVRCQRHDLRWLMNDQEDLPYAGLDCIDAEAVGWRLWWLADPLHTVPGNDRYVGHRARWVGLDLHMQELMTVGGWGRNPYYTDFLLGWGWPRGSWMWEFGVQSLARPGVTSHVSRLPGYRLIPSVDVRRPVMDVRDDDWQYVAHRYQERYDSPHGPFYRLEHFQLAFFPREGAVLAVVALDPADTPVPDGGKLMGGIALSRDEHDVRAVALESGTAGPFRVQAVVPAAPHLVSIETYRRGGGGAARHRFGAAPPELDAAGFGMSDLLLFEWDPELPEELDAVFPRMLATVRVEATAQLGVFWEAHGLAAGQDVTFSLSAVRAGGGALRRAAAALGLGRRDRLQFSWQERPEEDGVLGRTLRLDLSDLPAGTYVLRVAAAVSGRPEQAAERNFHIID